MDKKVVIAGGTGFIGGYLPQNLHFLDVENSENRILIALENIKIEIINRTFMRTYRIF